jgi:hypothetical protein
MAQLYSLGTTPIGKSFGLVNKFFDREELEMLQRMGNEEKLRDLEESIMMNASMS